MSDQAAQILARADRLETQATLEPMPKAAALALVYRALGLREAAAILQGCDPDDLDYLLDSQEES